MTVIVASGTVAASVPSDIYIATTGSDSTGVGSSGNPYATLAQALSILPSALTSAVTIHIADGTYTEGIDVHRFSNNYSALLTFVGNTTTPANVVFTGSVTTTQIDANASVTVSASVVGDVYLLVQGVTISGNGTPTCGLFVQNGLRGRTILDRCTITTSSGTTAEAVVAIGARVEFRGSVSLLNWTAFGILAIEFAEVGYTVAGTLTITGPGSVTSAQGIHISYHSHMICSAASTNITITNVQYGFQLGLHGQFQHTGSSSTITVSNASTPSSSAGVQGTDLSTWSASAGIVFTHLTNSVSINSITYAESTGAQTFTSCGNSASSQNSQTNGFP